MPAATTAEIRAWAQSHGYAVADRGRLPADVTVAYQAATTTSKRRSPAKKAASRSRATAAPRTASNGQKKPDGPKTAAGRAVQGSGHDDALVRRVRTLERQVAELTVRLDATDPARVKSPHPQRANRRS